MKDENKGRGMRVLVFRNLHYKLAIGGPAIFGGRESQTRDLPAKNGGLIEKRPSNHFPGGLKGKEMFVGKRLCSGVMV